jgi:hypothetical protein
LNLTDLATVKKYITNVSTNSDNVLAGLVSSESQTFLDEIGRLNLESASYSEVRSGTGSKFIQLMNFPVTAITSLGINGCPLSLSTAWNMKGYIFDANGKLTLICFAFLYGRGNIAVSYTAGYAPITVTAELQTIPATAPYTIQVANPNWRSDGGVNYFGGAALTPVSGAPSTGQYFVTPLGQNYAGQYLFAASDAGKQVQITYNFAGIPADIVGAVNEMVALRYAQRSTAGQDSQSIGDSTTKFTKDDYTKHVWRVIKKYKQRFSLPGF